MKSLSNIKLAASSYFIRATLKDTHNLEYFTEAGLSVIAHGSDPNSRSFTPTHNILITVDRNGIYV